MPIIEIMLSMCTLLKSRSAVIPVFSDSNLSGDFLWATPLKGEQASQYQQ